MRNGDEKQFDLTSYIKKKQAIINKRLVRILKKGCSGSEHISAAMEYSVMAGGKRIRPILCIAAFESVGQHEKPPPVTPDKTILDIACAIELIHTYSLIHDDLPAMDDDDLRRGKPTCHIAFNEAAAILAGDALLTLAFGVLASAGINSKKDRGTCLDIINRIAVATGPMGMIEGQMIDIYSENKKLSADELKKTHSLKTGAFIESSICCGAILGGGTGNQIELLNVYAKNIGLAFQVVDDILDVVGNPDKTGKAAGADEKLNKNAYPCLMGIKKSKLFARRLIDAALDSISAFDCRSDPLRAVARYIIERKN